MDSSHPTTPDEEKKSLDASPPEVLYDDLEKHAIDFSSEMKGMDFVEGEPTAVMRVVEVAGRTGDGKQGIDEVVRPVESPRMRRTTRVSSY